MVQVDIFWSYSLGAGMALAAARQIQAKHATANNDHSKPEASDFDKAFDSPYFLKTILYLAILFAPSGVALLWGFPSWETMHVGSKDMPTWLVTGFAISNITQGMLGYWVVRKLILSHKLYQAFLHYIAGYFMLFFILIHGWDGTGYMRFFSPTKAHLADWTWATAGLWLTSDVALTLYGMGVILLPILFYLQGSWIRNGIQEGNESYPSTKPAQQVSIGKIIFIIVATIFGAILPAAIAASVSVHMLGWLAGLAAFAVGAYLLFFRRGGIFFQLYKQTMLVAE